MSDNIEDRDRCQHSWMQWPDATTKCRHCGTLAGSRIADMAPQNRRGERDVRPWRPSDGDLRCQRCGRPNIVWYTDRDLWKTVMPDDGVVCVGCFVESAEQHLGIGVAWYLHHESLPTSSEFRRGVSAGMAITQSKP